MKTDIRLWAVVLTGALLLGCSRDPNVRKLKYFRSGQQYFQKGKYREAALEFQNAIQLDSRYADAHYQLAQVDLRESLYTGAYQELLRGVDL
jgi:Tfp pilus assembly protein PilF